MPVSIDSKLVILIFGKDWLNSFNFDRFKYVILSVIEVI